MNKKCILIVVYIFMLGSVGCTLPSTRMAQEGSFRSQAVTDSVHRDVTKALSRENFETAKMTILLDAEKAKVGQDDTVKSQIDAMALANIDALKEFARKRDQMLSWDRDHERANAYKYVTVDSKLFSEQGIMNYIASSLSKSSEKFFEAWDTASEKWNVKVKEKSN